MSDIIKHSEYRDWLRNLKQQIKTGQIKAALSVNSQMIMLYWDLGRQIAEKQEKAKWGSGFIEQLSKDLREEFPEMTGLSYDNLRFARRFYLFYSPISEQAVPKLGNLIMKQLVSQSEDGSHKISEQLVQQFLLVPWGHHILILKKTKVIQQALFYIDKTIENNWSRAVLEYQIESNLYGRQGKAVVHCGLDPQSPEARRQGKAVVHCGLDPQSPKERRNAA